jgi:hypothetical protein
VSLLVLRCTIKEQRRYVLAFFRECHRESLILGCRGHGSDMPRPVPAILDLTDYIRFRLKRCQGRSMSCHAVSCHLSFVHTLLPGPMPSCRKLACTQKRITVCFQRAVNNKRVSFFNQKRRNPVLCQNEAIRQRQVAQVAEQGGATLPTVIHSM